MQCMLASNVVWDIISTCVLFNYCVHPWCQQIASMHTDWWNSENDNNPNSRCVLALFLLTLALMRTLPLINTSLGPVATVSYCWELFWLVAGIWQGVMSVKRVWLSASLCILCIVICLMHE